ncbi:AAA family ATPase [Aliivibrio logei]|uniref:AAA family ATPase n=1 Tax=Aliivibrio logei TaxID=688 RepID=UPI0003A88E2C|nr:AAA family ATPase [Aliivibrio logei]
MKLINANISGYRNLNNIELDFDSSISPFFSIASPNGGGKSTLQQFIFTTIHCISSPKRHQFLKNLIDGIDTCERKEIAQYVFSDIEEQLYHLSLIIYPLNSNNYDFSALEGSAKSRDQILYFSKLLSELNYIKNIIREEGLESFSQNLTPSRRRLLRSAKSFTRDLHKNTNRLTTSEILNEFISYENYLEEELSLANEQRDYLALKAREIISNFKDSGEDILFTSDKYLISIQTNADDNKLNEISNSIYLCAPNSQSFLFLDKVARESIYSNDAENSYSNHINKSKEILNNFYTYDISPIDLILKSFKNARDLDFAEKLKTSVYGDNFDKITRELNSFLDDKEITVSNNLEKIIFSIPGQKKELNPEDLSHGELKKLSLYVFVKHISKQNSIILFDEIDIALHPSWQLNIVNELKIWSPDSQFVVATHSPQILASTHYKNIIQLYRDGTTTKVCRLASPPLDRDINAIISTVMKAQTYPPFILELQKKYRKYVDEGNTDSDEAHSIKKELLEHISINSEFFNDLEFDQDLFS